MKVAHFRTFAPVCPVCRGRDSGSPLVIQSVEQGNDECIDAGSLACSREGCQAIYPIIDGVPLILPDVRQFIAENITYLTVRDDFSVYQANLLGEASGAGGWWDTGRQQLSIYAHSHYGVEEDTEPPQAAQTLAKCLEGVSLPMDGPILDIGCAVGGTTFELASKSTGLALGVDLNIGFLRLARQAMNTGRVRYPLRKLGMVYQEACAPIPQDLLPRVDFWACDALALPFRPASVPAIVSLNVLDCVRAPDAFIAGIAKILSLNGIAVLASPYDWSAASTPQHTWLGQAGGFSDVAARQLIKQADAGPGRMLELVHETLDIPWLLRMHERSQVEYSLHCLAISLRNTAGEP